jgi:hypothetical protein
VVAQFDKIDTKQGGFMIGGCEHSRFGLSGDDVAKKLSKGRGDILIFFVAWVRLFQRFALSDLLLIGLGKRGWI